MAETRNRSGPKAAVYLYSGLLFLQARKDWQLLQASVSCHATFRMQHFLMHLLSLLKHVMQWHQLHLVLTAHLLTSTTAFSMAGVPQVLIVSVTLTMLA